MKIIEQYSDDWKTRTLRSVRVDARFVAFRWMGSSSVLSLNAAACAPAIVANHIKKILGEDRLVVDGHNYPPICIDLKNGVEDLKLLVGWLDAHFSTHWRDDDNAVFADYTMDEVISKGSNWFNRGEGQIMNHLNILSFDESMKADFLAGKITLEEAAIEWYEANHTKYVDVERAARILKQQN